MKALQLFFLTLALAQTAWTQQATSKSLNVLGNQKQVLAQLPVEESRSQFRVVEKRTVDRNNRLELGVSGGWIGGGDTYIQTKNLGVQADFHFTPRWSVGARYLWNSNDLTAEGKRVFDRSEAQANSGATNYIIPDVDAPVSTQLLTVNWYPIYGKVSWFESTTSQFDFYLLAGGGVMQLQSGNTSLATAGAGLGLWWNNRWTTRFEVRYQGYKDKIYSGQRQMDTVVGSLGVGLML